MVWKKNDLTPGKTVNAAGSKTTGVKEAVRDDVVSKERGQKKVNDAWGKSNLRRQYPAGGKKVPVNIPSPKGASVKR